MKFDRVCITFIRSKYITTHGDCFATECRLGNTPFYSVSSEFRPGSYCMLMSLPFVSQCPTLAPRCMCVYVTCERARVCPCVSGTRLGLSTSAPSLGHLRANFSLLRQSSRHNHFIFVASLFYCDTSY